MPWQKPLTLELGPVRLVPLERSHRDDLVKAASDGKLWELWYSSVPSEATIDAYLDSAFEEQAAGRALCFSIVHVYSEEIIGSTRFCNIDAANRRVEIGYTWYAKRYQRTGVNTRSKYLLLKLAFEERDCISVAFLTNFHNRASRKSISRLGAKQDGILRNHRINDQGVIRDTVVFSIIREEWKAVKVNLEFLMGNSRY